MAEIQAASPVLKLWLTHNRIKVADLESMADFYRRHFGMTLVNKYVNSETTKETYFLGYQKPMTTKRYSLDTALMELTSPGNTTSSKSPCRKNNEDKYSAYWKIGVNVYDLNLAVKGLKEAGVEMTEPLDIPEVGLLCHAFDPEGYDIELMQFTFPGKTLKYERNNENTIGQNATFSVITIRVSDIEESKRFYQDVLGMKLLCKQDQSKDYGFDVYYFGHTDEVPPNPEDPNDVANREWTYQRPYTLLEMEVYTRGPPSQQYNTVAEEDYGFLGIGMACSDIKSLISIMTKHNYGHYAEEYSDMLQTLSCIVNDPDNIPIRFIEIKEK